MVSHTFRVVGMGKWWLNSLGRCRLPSRCAYWTALYMLTTVYLVPGPKLDAVYVVHQTFLAPHR